MKPPRHSTVVAYVALFIALGGSATAASTALKANSVTSKQIKARSIQTSDLALSARPSAKSKLFRAAVTAVVLDPNTQAVVDSLAGAVKGEPGPKGDTGAAVQGPQGAAGTNGAQGRPGEALGYGHAYAGGSIDTAGTSSNVVVERVASGGGDNVNHWCADVTGGDPRNLVATADGDDAVAPAVAAPISVRVRPADGPCAGRKFEVMTARSFFFAVN